MSILERKNNQMIKSRNLADRLTGVDDLTVGKDTEAAGWVELGHLCSLKQRQIIFAADKPVSHKARKMKG